MLKNFQRAGNGKDGPRKQGWLDRYFNSRKAPARPQTAPRTTPMRIEPKTFFANERTFLSWLHMAITVGSIAAALLGFAGTATKTKAPARVCQAGLFVPQRNMRQKKENLASVYLALSHTFICK